MDGWMECEVYNCISNWLTFFWSLNMGSLSSWFNKYLKMSDPMVNAYDGYSKCDNKNYKLINLKQIRMFKFCRL